MEKSKVLGLTGVLKASYHFYYLQEVGILPILILPLLFGLI